MNKEALAYLERAEAALAEYRGKGNYDGFKTKLQAEVEGAHQHHKLEPNKVSMNESVALHVLTKTMDILPDFPTQEQVEILCHYVSELKRGTVILIGTVEYVCRMKETGLDMGEPKEPLIEYAQLLEKLGLSIRGTEGENREG